MHLPGYFAHAVHADVAADHALALDLDLEKPNAGVYNLVVVHLNAPKSFPCVDFVAVKSSLVTGTTTGRYPAQRLNQDKTEVNSTVRGRLC